MEITRKIIRWLCRACLAAIVLYMALMALLYWFLQRDPHRLASERLAEVSRATGLEFNFASLNVELLPLPSLSLGNLEISGNGLNIHTAWLSVRPDAASLLTGKLLPASIELIRPRAVVSADFDADKAAAYLKRFSQKPQSGDLEAAGDYSCRLIINGGRVELADHASRSLTLDGLNCDLKLAGFTASGDVKLASARAARNNKVYFSLENLGFYGKASARDPLAKSSFMLTGAARFAEIYDTASFYLHFRGGSTVWNARTGIDATLNLDGEAIPFSLAASAHGAPDGRKIHFSAGDFTLDADSGAFTASLDLPEKISDFNLSGQVSLRRASLTQWLGFARNLTPGLQMALDNISQAKLDFSLNAHSLTVPVIEAFCLGSTFHGKGGVADFAKPVVFLELKSPRVNLGAALPESLARTPTPVTYGHKTLTPMPGGPREPGDAGIGYDVNLGAEDLLFGPLTLKNVSLRIHPGPADAAGNEDIWLDGAAGFYGGKVSGKCVIGADAGFPVRITAKTANVNGAALARALPLSPFSKGQFKADIDISSRGKKLDAFLANLRGTVSSSGGNVAFRGQKENFSALAGDVRLRGASLEKNRLVFTGKWNMSLKDDKLIADCGIDGKIFFNAAGGGGFHSLPGHINITTGQKYAILPANTKISVNGNISAQGSRVSIEKASVQLWGLKSALNLTVNTNAPSWSGDFQTSNANIADICRRLGLADVKIPAPLRVMTVASAFSGNPGSLKLTRISATGGASKITGDFTYSDRGGRPFFQFTLATDRANLKDYTIMDKPAAKSGKWNFNFMRDFDLDGTIWAKVLDAWDIQLENAQTPVRLDKGNLSIGPMTARFYGSKLTGRALADFSGGVNFNAVIACHDFDLEQIAKSMKIKGELKGQASLDASVRAHVNGPRQLPGALNGQWAFSAINGSWRGREEDGDLKDSKTSFTKISASGQISGGVLKSQDFSMKGPGLSLTGAGWLNLADDKINCDFEVDMRGLPRFPLRLYGSLKNSETSIGAGALVVNAIGGLASGIVNVLGGIAGGIINIFR